MDIAQAAVSQVREAVLFEINYKEAYIKPHKPFNSRLEDDIQERYKGVFRKLLYFMQRAEDQNDNDRLPYRLIGKQGDLFDAFKDAVKQRVEDPGIYRASTGVQADRLQTPYNPRHQYIGQ